MKYNFTGAQKDHINIRIIHAMISGIPLYWALEPECQILMFMWSFGPLFTVGSKKLAPA